MATPQTTVGAICAGRPRRKTARTAAVRGATLPVTRALSNPAREGGRPTLQRTGEGSISAPSIPRKPPTTLTSRRRASCSVSLPGRSDAGPTVERLRVLEPARVVLARSMGDVVVPTLGDVLRQSEIGAGDLEELRALGRIAQALGRVHTMQ